MKWLDVSAGWSHVVLSGKKDTYAENKRVYAAGGRNDLGQLSCCDGEYRSISHIRLPQIIKEPTEHGIDKPLEHVVCGSEFTLALSSGDGCLYACGWNEHGNLGTGDVINGNEGWRKVQEYVETRNSNHKQHQNGQSHQKWPKSLAAGGAHCLVSLTSSF